MALLLHDGSRPAGAQHSYGQVIGERAARHEHSVFLAQQAGEPLLQLAHDATVREVVGLDPAPTGDVRQPGHEALRRLGFAVSAEDDGLGRVDAYGLDA